MTTADRNPKTHRAGLFLTAALGLALTGFAGTAHAQDPVTLSIIDRDTGQPLTVWRHDGRLFVAGRPGAGYCLRVKNNTGRRLEAVLSVDGVNIYTGETASAGQDGYVFNPYQSYDQCGWRKSLTEVAAFNFTALPNSYAARTGRPGNVGVIGMAVFYERPVPPAPSPSAAAANPSEVSEVVATGSYIRGAPEDASIPVEVTTRSDAVDGLTSSVAGSGRFAAPSPAPLAKAEKLGTGHGALEQSSIMLVSFNRDTATPQFSQEIEYDAEANLIARGVIPRRRRSGLSAQAVSLGPARAKICPRSAALTISFARLDTGRIDWRAMEPDTADDGVLLRAYTAGDPHAFARLYDRYDPQCFLFIRRMLGAGQAAAADDLHQETWMSVSLNARAFDPQKGSFRTWLFTIARRKVWDQFRRQKIAVLAPAQDDAAMMVPDDGPSPFEQVQSRELAERLVAAVEALPLEQRGTFVMFADGGLSLEEIALATGVGIETAKSRLRYARTQLRHGLASERSGHV